MRNGWFVFLFVALSPLAITAQEKPGNVEQPISASISWNDLQANSLLSGVGNKTMALKFASQKDVSWRLVVLFRPFPYRKIRIKDDENLTKTLKKNYGHLGLDYCPVVRRTKNVDFYAAIGPALQITEKNDGETHKKILDNYTFGLAFSFSTGIEYFIHSNVSILGEFTTLVQSGMDVRDNIYLYHNSTYEFRPFSLHTWFIDPFVHIGFAFYL